MVIGGDVNAHHLSWGSSDTNPRGEKLMELIMYTNLTWAFQKPHESVRQFAARIEALSYKTVPVERSSDPAAEAQRQDLLLSVFIEGLQLHLRRLLLPQNHKTFASAKQHAIIEEDMWAKSHASSDFATAEVRAVNAAKPANEKSVTTPSVTNSELTTAIKMQQENIAQLTKMMGSLQTQVQSLISQGTRSRPIQPRCYRCNRIGHVSRDCYANIVPNQHSRQGQHRFRNNQTAKEGDILITPHQLFRYGALLGTKFLADNNMHLDFSTSQLLGSNVILKWNLSQPSAMNSNVFSTSVSQSFCYSVTKHKLPPFSENIIKLTARSANFTTDTVLIEPLIEHAQRMKLASAQPVNVITHNSELVNNTTIETGEDFESWGGEFDLTHLPEQQQQQLSHLLNQYSNIFAASVTELTGCDTILHNINLRDNIPVRQKPYKVPYHLRDELDRQVAELLEANIIQESDSPYSAPVLFVKKADNTYRLVTDFRKLNEKTIEDSFPLPSMIELIEQLGDSNYFSTLDLTSGFFQMKIHPDDTFKSGFLDSFWAL
ncbi:uncharacterized protein LOC118193307 [Stegodyphus dumicola]|uniref:uncharacterized protein LOC118193307 n=1 Tax=Stegodyphus dumicola TaxID=202533 RepID=UPI0015ABA446|nr:uncharacterized protein LOC118193307 [Stegodyphus dumicola]